MNYEDIEKQVAEELNIPVKVVRSAYLGYWRCIRAKIKEAPLKEELTEEEFHKYYMVFPVHPIGKIYCTWKRYQRIKRQYKKYLQIKREKQND